MSLDRRSEVDEAESAARRRVAIAETSAADERRAGDASRVRKPKPRTRAQGALESEVLEAFIAQHYIGNRVPPVLVVSHAPSSRELVDLLIGTGRATRSRCCVSRRARSARGSRWPNRTRSSRSRGCCRSKARSRRARARSRTRSAWRWTISRNCASSASTSAIRWARRRRRRAWCITITRCSRANTGATTSPASRPATTTPRCARCSRAATRRWSRRQPRTRTTKPTTLQPDDAADPNVTPDAAEPVAAGGILPNIVLIDGGKGQVEIARQVFSELGLDHGMLVGVAKGEGRKVGLETLMFADGRSALELGKESAALMLVAQIRDEAHRFAITGMRAKRAKSATDFAAGRARRRRRETASAAAVALRRFARRAGGERRGSGERRRHFACARAADLSSVALSRESRLRGALRGRRAL